MGKDWEVPVILQKLSVWIPFTKDYINEYFPEHGCKVWFVYPETGKRIWECPRPFYGTHDISPDGHLLVTHSFKKESIEIEMWDTHNPQRWVWILGYLGILGLWYWWRSSKAMAGSRGTPLDPVNVQHSQAMPSS